jgi:hypothetical protein
VRVNIGIGALFCKKGFNFKIYTIINGNFFQVQKSQNTPGLYGFEAQLLSHFSKILNYFCKNFIKNKKIKTNKKHVGLLCVHIISCPEINEIKKLKKRNFKMSKENLNPKSFNRKMASKEAINKEGALILSFALHFLFNLIAFCLIWLVAISALAIEGYCKN